MLTSKISRRACGTSRSQQTRGCPWEGAQCSSSAWKKKLVFWKLPYWPVLSVRHCLDPMHIAYSNVAPFFTLYNVAQCPGKNGWWDEGPILGCTNAIGDPRPDGRKQ